jgi:hypothetical protein
MTIPRDLTNTAERLSDDIASHDRLVRQYIAAAEEEPDNPHQYYLARVPRLLAEGLFMRYARGDTLDALRHHFHDEYLPTLRHGTRLSAHFFPDHLFRIHVENQYSWMLLLLLACFDEDGTLLRDPGQWFTHDGNTPLYAMVLKGLAPDYAYDGTYTLKHTPLQGDEQLLKLLLQPSDTWQHGCAAFMRNWPKTAKVLGYREHLDERKHPCPAFPNNLALVVCAFDIDDSDFRHLPFYPHELVNYYRVHRRPGRAPWRDPAQDLPDSARPKPKKIYALSKSEAYARWVELVSGHQLEHARKALGKRKTMPELFAAAEALAAVGLAICADIKDHATVDAQGRALYATWQQPWPADDGSTREGPARITELFNAMDAAPGPRLAVLTDESDTWIAVLVRREDDTEFDDLCEQLEVGRLARADWQ